MLALGYVIQLVGGYGVQRDNLKLHLTRSVMAILRLPCFLENSPSIIELGDPTYARPFQTVVDFCRTLVAEQQIRTCPPSCVDPINQDEAATAERP